MNFTQSFYDKEDLTDHNKITVKNGLDINSTTTLQSSPAPTEKTDKVGKLKSSSPWQWTSGVLGAFYGVLVLLIIIIACWLFREEYCRQKKGLDGSKRYVFPFYQHL